MDLSNYPHIFPPPGFIPVNRVGSFSVPANTTKGVLLNAPTGDNRILIPNLYDGWLYKAGIVLNTYVNVTFSITANGVPLRDYNRLNGPLQAPETPGEVYLKLPPSQPIDILVNNASGAAVAARWRLFGWYYKL